MIELLAHEAGSGFNWWHSTLLCYTAFIVSMIYWEQK